MQDTATPGAIYVHNGCTANLAIPCWYMEVHPPVPAKPHDRVRHDMLGWPWPDKPDGSCQEWDFDRGCCRRTPHMKRCPPECEHFIDLRRMFPIHLSEEGYGDVSVNVVDSEGSALIEGITATASIDDVDDWIVRVLFDVRVPGLMTPEDGTATYYYSIYLSADGGARDLVAMGKLIVLPAPLEAN